MTTGARLGTGGTLVVPGEVVLEASQHTSTETIGRGDVDAETAGIALALALAIVEDEVTAHVARSVSAAAVSLGASGSSANEGVTDAAAPGAPKDPNGGVNQTADKWLGQGNAVSTATTGKSSKSSGTPKAATSDGAVSVAGAFTVSIVTTVSKAWLSDGLVITATDGPVTLASSANTDVAGEAKGTTATKAGIGVGAGVVVNLVSMTNLATTGASRIDAHGIDVSATMTEVEDADDPSADPDVIHTISADATAGASKTSDLGVAGALALNIVTASTQALVPAGATLVMHDGDVTVTAGYAEADVAGASANPTFKACAQVLGLPCLISKKITGENTDGAGVGIGASAAIQVLASTLTKAEIADGVSLTGGHDVTISATSERWISTVAEAGSKGGTAISPAVALVVNSGENATARLGTGPTLDISGALVIAAVHTTDLTETQANGDVKSTNVGIGMALALPIVIGWTTLAELARNATVESAAITAESRIAVLAQANASSVGQEKTSTTKSADTTATDTVKNDPNAGGKGADALPKANDAAKSGSSASSAQSGQGSSSVGIAAAFGVAWVQATNMARVVGGITITATGPVLVGAYQLTEITARGTGTALNTDADSTGFGIGVGFAYLDIASSALVGTNTTLTGDDITVEATTPLDDTTGDPLENTVTVWGIAAAGGKGDPQIAGSAGIIVVAYVTTASVGAGSTLTSTGDLTVRADNPMGMQNLALAAGLALNGQGVGAAIAITVLTGVTTTAAIESSVASPTTTNAPGSTTVEATAHLSPLPFDIINDLLADFADTIKDLPVVGMDSLETPPFSSVALGGGAGSGDLGVGGSFIVIVGNRTTDAHIGAAARVNQTNHGTTSQTVSVLARDDVDMILIAGGIGVSTKGTGVGVAVIVAVTNQDVRATVGNGVRIWSGGDVTVRAISTDPVLAAAASLGVAKDTGAAGSFIVIVQNQGSGAPGTRATVGGGSAVADRVTITAAGNLEVSARRSIDDNGDATPIRLYAGGLAIGAGTAGVGVAASVLVRASRVLATIGQGATLDASALTGGTTPGLLVSASQLGDIMLIAVAGGVGRTAGIAGSATIDVLTDVTTASIGADSQVNQASLLAGTPGRQDVVVIATDHTTIVGAGGMIAVGGSAGIGAGADVVVLDKTTTASIGDRSRVRANGDVVVSAASSERITSISVGGAGSGSVAIALNAAVSVITVRTNASLGADTVVRAGGNVLVTADEVLELLLVAGNVSAAGSASVGAGAAVPIVTKVTTATVGARADVTAYGLVGRVGHGTVNTGGYTMTQQDPRFDPRGFSDGNPVPQGLVAPGDPDAFAIVTPTPHGFADGQQVIYDNGGGASIGGLTDGGTYYVIRLSSTKFQLSLAPRGPPIVLSLPNALMGESHRLVPTSSAQPVKDASPRFIPAKDVSGSIITLPYAFTKKNSGGSTVATPLKTGDSVVYSSGGGTAIGGLADGETYYAIVLATTGSFGAQQIRLATTNARALAGLFITLNPGAATGTSHSIVPSGFLPAADPRSTNPQTAHLTTQTGFSGVAVTATNSDSINAIGISAGVSGTVAVNVSGTVSVIDVTTTASIGASAKINCAAADADLQRPTSPPPPPPSRSSSWRATPSTSWASLPPRPAPARSPPARASPSASSPSTPPRASADNAVVNASGDIIVEADARESFVSVAAAAAIGVDAGLAGAVGVTVLSLTTSATTGTGVTLRAGNNLLVLANDTTDLVLVAASLGAGVWAGFGAGVSVGVVTKTTEAHLGANNVVVVLARAPPPRASTDGTSNTDGTFGTKVTFHGLAVQAHSTETLFGLTAGIAGGFIGIAGGIGVNIFTVVVKAFIAGGTTVNQGASGIIAGASSSQSVVVSATDSFETPDHRRRHRRRRGRHRRRRRRRESPTSPCRPTSAPAATCGPTARSSSTPSPSKRVRTYAVSLGGGVVGRRRVGDGLDRRHRRDEHLPERRERPGPWRVEHHDRLRGRRHRLGVRRAVLRPQPQHRQEPDDEPDRLGAAGLEQHRHLRGRRRRHLGWQDLHRQDADRRATPRRRRPPTGPLSDESPTGTSTGSADTPRLRRWRRFERRLGQCARRRRLDPDVDERWHLQPGPARLLRRATTTSPSTTSRARSSTPPRASRRPRRSGRSATTTTRCAPPVPRAARRRRSPAPRPEARSPPHPSPSRPRRRARPRPSTASVHAGGDVQVRATDRLDLTSVAGVAAVGLGALGAGVAIVTVGLATDAGIASTGSVSSGGTVGVHAVLVESIDGLAAAGAIGGVAISGQVVVITDSSSQNAHIDTGATVPKATTRIAVDTVATRTISARTYGVSIAVGAIGASVAIATISGDTLATIGNVAIGSEGAVGGLVVSSTDTLVPTNQAVLSAGRRRRGDQRGRGSHHLLRYDAGLVRRPRLGDDRWRGCLRHRDRQPLGPRRQHGQRCRRGRRGRPHPGVGDQRPVDGGAAHLDERRHDLRGRRRAGHRLERRDGGGSRRRRRRHRGRHRAAGGDRLGPHPGAARRAGHRHLGHRGVGRDQHRHGHDRAHLALGARRRGRRLRALGHHSRGRHQCLRRGVQRSRHLCRLGRLDRVDRRRDRLGRPPRHDGERHRPRRDRPRLHEHRGQHHHQPRHELRLLGGLWRRRRDPGRGNGLRLRRVGRRSRPRHPHRHRPLVLTPRRHVDRVELGDGEDGGRVRRRLRRPRRLCVAREHRPDGRHRRGRQRHGRHLDGHHDRKRDRQADGDVDRRRRLRVGRPRHRRHRAHRHRRGPRHGELHEHDGRRGRPRRERHGDEHGDGHRRHRRGGHRRRRCSQGRCRGHRDRRHQRDRWPGLTDRRGGGHRRDGKRHQRGHRHRGRRLGWPARHHRHPRDGRRRRRRQRVVRRRDAGGCRRHGRGERACHGNEHRDRQRRLGRDRARSGHRRRRRGSRRQRRHRVGHGRPARGAARRRGGRGRGLCHGLGLGDGQRGRRRRHLDQRDDPQGRGPGRRGRAVRRRPARRHEPLRDGRV